MSIRTVGIIGAGTMGNGIAQACAVVGIDAVMLDINEAAVQKGIATVSGSLDRLVKKEKMTVEQKAAAMARGPSEGRRLSMRITAWSQQQPPGVMRTSRTRQTLPTAR